MLDDWTRTLAGEEHCARGNKHGRVKMWNTEECAVVEWVCAPSFVRLFIGAELKWNIYFVKDKMPYTKYTFISSNEHQWRWWTYCKSFTNNPLPKSNDDLHVNCRVRHSICGTFTVSIQPKMTTTTSKYTEWIGLRDQSHRVHSNISSIESSRLD